MVYNNDSATSTSHLFSTLQRSLSRSQELNNKGYCNIIQYYLLLSELSQSILTRSSQPDCLTISTHTPAPTKRQTVTKSVEDIKDLRPHPLIRTICCPWG